MDVACLHWLLLPLTLVYLEELLAHKTLLVFILVLEETHDLLLLYLVQVLLHLEHFELLADLVYQIYVSLYLAIHKYYIIPVFS